MDPPIPVDFTNVMEESEPRTRPLHVHLGYRDEAETVQALLDGYRPL